MVDQNTDGPEVELLCAGLRGAVKQLTHLQPELAPETETFLDSVETLGALTDIVAANWNFTFEEKVKLLEVSDVKERLRMVLKVLHRYLDAFGGMSSSDKA